MSCSAYITACVTAAEALILQVIGEWELGHPEPLWITKELPDGLGRGTFTISRDGRFHILIPEEKKVARCWVEDLIQAGYRPVPLFA
jgi:hypothetical protein